MFLGLLLSALVFGQEKAIPVSTLGVERLEHLEMRVADVADAAGFADETSFFRNFKQATGLTPSAWRTKMNNNLSLTK